MWAVRMWVGLAEPAAGDCVARREVLLALETAHGGMWHDLSPPASFSPSQVRSCVKAVSALVFESASAAGASCTQPASIMLCFAGVCYRLWDAGDGLDETTPPEMANADLAPLALELACHGCPDGEGLAWLDAPDPERLASARELLRDLGAVTDSGGITDEGELGLAGWRVGGSYSRERRAGEGGQVLSCLAA